MTDPDFLSKTGNWLFICALAIITFLVFQPCLSAYFVNWDDNVYLINNKVLEPFSQSWSWDAVKTMFTTNGGGNYNPLPIFTYAIEKYFFAPQPLTSTFIFHFDNLLLHIACTVGVFFLFRRLGLTKPASFVGALLFGIHPMRVESVAWITERKDVLYGIFFIFSLLAYINYINNSKRKWYIYALILSVGAYFSKVQAVTLPLSMVALDVFFKRKWYAPKILLFEKLPWWALSLAIGLVNLSFLKEDNVLVGLEHFSHFNIVDKVALGSFTYFIYIAKLVYPYQMLAVYEYPVTVPLLAYVSLIATILLVLALWLVRKKRDVLLGVSFFTVNVMFMLQVVSAGTSYQADRYTYIAYIGLFFLFVKGGAWLFAHKPKLKYVTGCAACVYLLSLMVTAYNQTRVWSNSVSLWTNCIDHRPDKYFGYFMRGCYYQQVVMNKWPDPFVSANDQANLQAALSDLSTAIAINSVAARNGDKINADVLVDRGVVCGMLQQYDSSISDFTRAIQIVPNRKDCYSNRAITYTAQKKYALAVKDYKAFISLDNSSDVIYYGCAVCEDSIGDIRGAANDMTSAIALNPGNPAYYINRAYMYKALNVVDSTHMDARRAQQMGVNVPFVLLQ